MQYNLLINKIFRLSFGKAIKLVEDYNEKIKFKTFAENQRVLDILTEKQNSQKMIKDEVYQQAYFYLRLMTKDNGEWSNDAFENMKALPLVVWMEVLGLLDPNDIVSILDNYQNEFNSLLIETFIINLPENMQSKMIEKYKNKIDPKGDLYQNFYYSVSDDGREKLDKIYPGIVKKDILLELEDISSNELINEINQRKDELLKIPADQLIEFILLKVSNVDLLDKIFQDFKDSIQKCSNELFELLVTRYKFLKNNSFKRNLLYCDEQNTQNQKPLTNEELFYLFKNRFNTLGLERTLSLFNIIEDYESNSFTELVVLEFIDKAYSDINISKYINAETIFSLIGKFSEKCFAKDYSLEDFEILVKKAGLKQKLIFDDFIEAIVACGKLMKENKINDKNPLFLELRDKFTNDLISRCKKDGTYLESISLNGVFYRLAKGSIPFELVYTTETYKGLIYISKCRMLDDAIYEADYITEFLTDEQLFKLNITPVIRWKNTLKRENTGADNFVFIERMGLQLLCYFGENKAKYLLESNMQGNRMENLFDGLNYGEISINEDDKPNINTELIDYLFGKGKTKETNSVMNRMIRGEIVDFERYFTDFCNSFYSIKDACNGILSVKRIVKHYIDVALPIDLKPDEIIFKNALKEMNTIDSDRLNEAIGLCKDARNRKYSSIPKVKGTIGDFTYEVLDLGDPLAVAVGNLSHCCFVVRGISYSALKHSMQSSNGRTFVVYYKGRFLTQSWIWRNGDVICFDSVEAGSPYHEAYSDDIKLVDVYQKAAQEMLNVSSQYEDEIQRVKVVTVGRSDYSFNGLADVLDIIPRPLETNLYVYDSNKQCILAGNMPVNPRFGKVGFQYKDPRKKPMFVNDVRKCDIDLLDDILININSLRYQIKGIETSLDVVNVKKIICGDGWYIIFKDNGDIECGMLQGDERVNEEYNEFLKKYGINSNNDDNSLINDNNLTKTMSLVGYRK